MEEPTKAFKKVNSTVPAELSLSTSLLEDSFYSFSDSESQSSCSQEKQVTCSEISSMVKQVDVQDRALSDRGSFDNSIPSLMLTSSPLLDDTFLK